MKPPPGTCRGVIHGLDSSINKENLGAYLQGNYPTLLHARIMGNTRSALLTFQGTRVPFYVKGGSMLLRCRPFRRSVQVCHVCGELGHRMDVCPNPDSPKCLHCGQPTPSADHVCIPKCRLCSQPHTTAGKDCPRRFFPNSPTSKTFTQAADKRTAIFIARSLTAQVIPITSPIDHVLVEILPHKPQAPSLYILNVYSLPTQPLSAIEALLSAAVRHTRNNPCLLLGDFNAPHVTWGYPYASKKGTALLQATQHHHFTLQNDLTLPTRLGTTVTRGTIPDLTFSRNTTDLIWDLRPDTLGSDHYIIALTAPLMNPPQVIRTYIISDNYLAPGLHRKYGSDPTTLYPDASPYPQRPAHVATVARIDNAFLTSATVCTASTTTAEEAAIALAMTQATSPSITIMSDSQAACRRFALGRVSALTLAILTQCPTLPHARIVWTPSHTALPGNEVAHATARALLHRAFPEEANNAASIANSLTPLSQTYADILYHYRATRRTYPPPHPSLSTADARIWRRLQTNTYYNHLHLHHISPANYPLNCPQCDEPSTTAHLVWTCPTNPPPPRSPTLEQWECVLQSCQLEDQEALISRARMAAAARGLPE
ncbi:hypothetical protein ISCGN_009034 [Ixodes scapularis]